MKNSQKSVLPFPAPPPEPEASTINVQIGRERFAIHYEIEELPPGAPLLTQKPRTKKRTLKIVTFPDLPFGTDKGKVWTNRVGRTQDAN